MTFHCAQDADVIHKVVRERRTPLRPAGAGVDAWLSDPLWRLLNTCWAQDPRRRMRMDEVAKRMTAIEAAQAGARAQP